VRRGCGDVIALAQASMARVVEALPPNPHRPPILASPPLAIDRLAAEFAAAASTTKEGSCPTC